MQQATALKSIPVVVLSTSDRESDVEMANSYGVVDYWVKPIAHEIVQNYLKEHFSLQGEAER